MIARIPVVALAVLLAGGVWSADRAAAQTVAGTVVDPETDAPLGGVHIRLLDEAGDAVGATFSRDDGRFHLTAPSSGTWRIAAEMIGRATITSPDFELEADGVARVEIRMGVEALELEDPVVITTRRSPSDHEFHRRRLRRERSGFGHFIHGDDLEFTTSRPTELLRRVPGVSVMGSGGPGPVVTMRGGCVPALYIDGMQINLSNRRESLDTYVNVHDLEGIEVYKGMQAPGRYFDPVGCGVVLAWTKRGEVDPDRPFSWTRLLVGLGLIAGLLMLR